MHTPTERHDLLGRPVVNSRAGAVSLFALPPLLGLVLALGLAGCATRPVNTASLTPAQVVQSLRVKEFRTTQESDPVFGLQGLRWQLAPAIQKCQASGGDLQALKRVQVSFAARTNAFGAVETHLLLPERLACRNSAGFLWGANLAYTRTTFFPSQWTGDVHYYADLQPTFVSAEQLNLVEESSAQNIEAARRVSAQCAQRRAEYTNLLRTKPAVGMTVAFGTIVDLRPPLALVQYDAFGRQVKGKEQEWVQVSTLSAGSDCP